MGRYEPTVQEILTIRSYCLLRSPDDLVDTILDEACHRAQSTVTVKYPAGADSWYLADYMYMYAYTPPYDTRHFWTPKILPMIH